MLDHREQATEVADAEEREADAINLRTYGWAGDYIYGHSQDLARSVSPRARSCSPPAP